MRPDDPRIVNFALALAALLAPETPPGGADLLGLPEAARIAATSIRVLRQAIAEGDLQAFGKQRDRSIRRADLLAWIESRRVHLEGADDADLQKRMRRLRVLRGAAR